MARAVGIDLGTTNSVVAVLSGGEPEVIANTEGARTTPSVVAFAKNGDVLVGEVAKRQAVTNVERTARSVKRHMGEAQWRFPDSGDIDGKSYTAQEISARVLQKLKRDAEAYLGKQFKNGYGIDLSKDKMATQRLREAAEKAKMELSSATETTVNLPYITASAEGPLHLDEKLTRAQFQQLTADLLERCKEPFHNVIKDAGIQLSEIDHVVLVGGSTRMPAVAELVKELTGGKEANKGVNPDEVVAIG